MKVPILLRGAGNQPEGRWGPACFKQHRLFLLRKHICRPHTGSVQCTEIKCKTLKANVSNPAERSQSVRLNVFLWRLHTEQTISPQQTGWPAGQRRDWFHTEKLCVSVGDQQEVQRLLVCRTTWGHSSPRGSAGGACWTAGPHRVTLTTASRSHQILQLHCLPLLYSFTLWAKVKQTILILFYPINIYSDLFYTKYILFFTIIFHLILFYCISFYSIWFYCSSLLTFPSPLIDPWGEPVRGWRRAERGRVCLQFLGFQQTRLTFKPPNVVMWLHSRERPADPPLQTRI